jgi:hypothetical protein
MSNKFTLFVTASVILVFSSCKKDSSGPPPVNTITGNYIFVSASADLTSTTQVSSGGVTLKTVSISKYTTIDNGGTLRITADTIYATGLTYSVDTTFLGYEYMNNQLIDSFSFPLTVTLSPTDEEVKYRLITSDSIYFDNGSLFSVSGGGSTATQPGGEKYVLNGNTLTLTGHVNQKNTDNSSGTPETITTTGIATTILQKQ